MSRRSRPAGSPAPSRVVRRPPALSQSTPRWIDPQLATLVDEPPEGDEWVHEQKYDGYRILAFRDGGEVRLLSRNQKDWSERFRPIAQAMSRLRARRFVIDGEICVLGRGGATSFRLLQQSFQTDDAAEYTYFVFDLLFLDGEDLRGLPLESRKERLRLALGKGSHRCITYSVHAEAGGRIALDAACRNGWEGIISKLRSAPYRGTRNRSWVKSKCGRSDEFCIAGYTRSATGVDAIGALLLALPTSQKGIFHYCGKVGTGFSDKQRRELWRNFRKLPESPPRLDNKGDAPKHVFWIRPALVVQIAFTEWTAARMLRHPAFVAVREDKTVRDLIPKGRSKARPRARNRR